MIECPECGSRNVEMLIHGRTMEELKEESKEGRKMVMGVTCSTGLEDTVRCRDCGKGFRYVPDEGS